MLDSVYFLLRMWTFYCIYMTTYLFLNCVIKDYLDHSNGNNKITLTLPCQIYGVWLMFCGWKAYTANIGTRVTLKVKTGALICEVCGTSVSIRRVYTMGTIVK